MISTFGLLFLFLLVPVFSLNKCTELYDRLEVSKDADNAEISRAFRRLSRKYHPDKTKDHTMYFQIKEAEEVLTNSLRRSHYDNHCEIISEEEAKRRKSSTNIFDFLSVFVSSFVLYFYILNFFILLLCSSGGSGRNEEHHKKRDDLIIPIDVSLEQLYNGAYLEFQVRRPVVCDHCKGTGADGKDGMHTCHQCGGKGYHVVRQMVGPGMFMTSQQKCNVCSGKGQIIRKKCPICNGLKSVVRTQNAHIKILPGMKHDDQITSYDMGDSGPSHEPRNIVFKINEMPAISAPFRRENSHLHTKVVLSLWQALGGFNLTLRHMDGRIISFSRRNVVTQPGQIDVIEGEGMPGPDAYKNERGNLFIEYTVVLPELPLGTDVEREASRKKLQELLNPSSSK